MAEDVGSALGGPGESREDAQRRGLSGAVAPEEAEDGAGPDDEIDMVKRERVAEPLRQAAELDRGRCVHR